MKKRIAKKIEKKFGKIPEGYGVIVSGYKEHHFHPVGTLVKIEKTASFGYFNAYDEKSGLIQGVKAQHVQINKYN